jgi:hypothetical protein
MAPPFWDEIDRMEGHEKENYEKLRMIYASALVNGPFGIICGYGRGMFGLNDRIKLRPMERAAYIKGFAEKQYKNVVQAGPAAFGNAATGPAEASIVFPPQ